MGDFRPARIKITKKTELLLGMCIIKNGGCRLSVDFGGERLQVGQMGWEGLTFNGKH